MLFTLIRPDDHETYRDVVEDVYRLRHRIFNDWLGWNLPHEDGQEKDAFDDGAFLFICQDRDGDVVGTWRAMPTVKPFFSKGAFPALFDQIPHWTPDSMTWDLSRMALDRAKYVDDRAALGQIACGMACCIFETAIVHGITQLIATQDHNMTALANHWLGEPDFSTDHIDTGGGNVGLYCYAPTLERLYAMRTQMALPTPTLSNLRLFDAGHPTADPVGELSRGVYAS